MLTRILSYSDFSWHLLKVEDLWSEYLNQGDHMNEWMIDWVSSKSRKFGAREAKCFSCSSTYPCTILAVLYVVLLCWKISSYSERQSACTWPTRIDTYLNRTILPSTIMSRECHKPFPLVIMLPPLTCICQQMVEGVLFSDVSHHMY